MRVNVYEEEISRQSEMVTKRSDGGDVFVGVRLYLDTPPSVPKGSAVTIWSHSAVQLKAVLTRLVACVDRQIERETLN